MIVRRLFLARKFSPISLVHCVRKFTERVNSTEKKAHKDNLFLDEDTVNIVKKTTADSIHEINKVYHDLEQNLMKRINESNTRRFRLIFIGGLLVIVWVSAVFGARIKKSLARQTAGLAKETLENESLKVQTQELATVSLSFT